MEEEWPREEVGMGMTHRNLGSAVPIGILLTPPSWDFNLKDTHINICCLTYTIILGLKWLVCRH